MSQQEREELVQDLIRLVTSRLLDPLDILLGDDPAIEATRHRVRQDAGTWADELLGDDRARATHQGARLVAVLYPGDTAFDPPADWWRTPLGRAIARRVGHPSAERVSYAVAGAMLGITRQGVHDLVRRGKLHAHPDGGVTTPSIRERLDTRDPGQAHEQ
ncbi:hypothetical protein LDL08_15315 [Nonomuraea glycinis]|uniref:Uncharacterized protein n=1 Tax=Nonomuraea glycinis TaxID=2047744 RepID=A0A918A956_9ACTN|nr:hypothetical protein [Nonomuraea glycinis]MCA2177557.1 hypothetical protein [Nonomuraea glycinis]GGP09546.1 hypothetical protein GCM10012278_45670 [Nonomuraea glycinis]